MDQNNAGSATGIDLTELPQLETLAAQVRDMREFHPWNLGQVHKLAGKTLALIALARATPQHPRPTDDHLWDETLRDRDNYEEWADKLAGAIAVHFGVDIGEHSNMNCPWTEALDAIESAPSADAATPQHSVTEQNERDWPAGYAAWLRATGAYPFDNDKRNQVDAFKAGAQWALAQPLASTAAQPEQALCQVDAVLDHCLRHHAHVNATRDAVIAARAALAIPASTAASEPVFAWLATDLDGRGDVGLTKEEAKRRAGEGCTIFIPLYDTAASEQQAGADEECSECDGKGFYRDDDENPTFEHECDECNGSGRVALTRRATTAADQQGDTASASGEAPDTVTVKITNSTTGESVDWDVPRAAVEAAQQGAAQARAGEIIPEQRNVLSVERYGDSGATVVFRSCRAASAFITAVRAAMGVPATSGGKA